MTSRFQVHAAIVLLVVAGTASCTGGVSGAPKPGQTSGAASVAPQPVGPRDLVGPTGEALDFEVVDLVATPPTPVSTEVLAEQSSDPQTDLRRLLAAGGTTLLAALLPAVPMQGDALTWGQGMVLVDGDAEEDLGSTRGIAKTDGPRQAYAGDLDESWAVWVETSSADPFTSNWRVFERELAGGSPRLVARAEEQHDGEILPLAVGDPEPVLSEGRIWWHTAYERPDGTFRTRVVTAEHGADGAEPVADLAAHPVPVTGGVAAVRMHDQSVEGALEGWEIQDPRRAEGIILLDESGEERGLVTFGSTTDDDWFVSERSSPWKWCSAR